MSQDHGGAGGGTAVSQYISFTIGDEEYGVDIMAIREIKGWTATTALPNSTPHMRGVINLRGAIIPIFDLRARFNAGLTQPSARHVIIVVAVEQRMVGLLVDAVADILSIAVGDIQPVPELEHGDAAEFLSGLVTVDGRMVALLDLPALFSLDPTDVASSAA